MLNNKQINQGKKSESDSPAVSPFQTELEIDLWPYIWPILLTMQIVIKEAK